ncbi:MAG TPA: glycerol kinase, partial [Rhodocyclaceae bacterium]|nr:glycerol kinase [Rhodocyclaceae bacterium]
ELRVDGGASANALLMQLQADLLGVPVARGRIKETTALGAAALAGLAAGVWPSSDAIRDSWKADRVFEPRMDSERAQAMMATWRAAVRCARGWSAARG